jgi:hypothetical protein
MSINYERDQIFMPALWITLQVSHDQVDRLHARNWTEYGATAAWHAEQSLFALPV